MTIRFSDDTYLIRDCNNYLPANRPNSNLNVSFVAAVLAGIINQIHRTWLNIYQE